MGEFNAGGKGFLAFEKGSPYLATYEITRRPRLICAADELY